MDELSRFLEALDAALQEPARLVVIGGSALVLGYGGTAATNDIDTYESRSRVIEEAAEAARMATGLRIPIADSGVANLEILVLDRHDLAASKLIRGNEHDRQQLAHLHALAPLDLQTLLVRFRELMRELVGDATEPWWALRHFVEETWGELEAAEIDDEIRRLRNGTVTPK